MINYNFRTAFAPQLEAGAKTCTLRRHRKPPSRHANAGEPIGLWTGLRSKEARRRGVGLVTVRALVRFEPAGIRTVSEVRVRDALDEISDALLSELMQREADAFARRDGFENWSSAWAWHDAERERGEENDASLLRNLIAWTPLSAEQIEALETGKARLQEVA